MTTPRRVELDDLEGKSVVGQAARGTTYGCVIRLCNQGVICLPGDLEDRRGLAIQCIDVEHAGEGEDNHSEHSHVGG